METIIAALTSVGEWDMNVWREVMALARRFAARGHKYVTFDWKDPGNEFQVLQKVAKDPRVLKLPMCALEFFRTFSRGEVHPWGFQQWVVWDSTLSEHGGYHLAPDLSPECIPGLEILGGDHQLWTTSDRETKRVLMASVGEALRMLAECGSFGETLHPRLQLLRQWKGVNRYDPLHEPHCQTSFRQAELERLLRAGDHALVEIAREGFAAYPHAC